MVHLPAGQHVAEVRYVAPSSLRAAYALSLLALVGWMTSFPALSRRRPQPGFRPGRNATALIFLASVICLGIGAAWYLHYPSAVSRSMPPLGAVVPSSAGSGAVRLKVVFPAVITQPAEPLLLTGKTGAADLVYVHYLPGRRLQLGFDHWSVGGPLSAPIDYTPGTVEEIEVAHAALFDGGPSSTPPEFRDPSHSRVIVRWNGKVALDFVAAVYPGQGGVCVAGANPVGASSCAPEFTGAIVEVRRFLPGGPREPSGN